MATQEERNARLDALGEATKAWAKTRTKQLKTQVELSKKILQSRPGGNKLAQASVDAVSDLTVDEIDNFLTGD